MKKLILIFLLSLSVVFAKAQAVPISLVALSTVTDLRLQAPQANQMITLLGLSAVGDGNGGTYYWNNNSTATDDGFITVQVTGISTGRWLRLGSSNTLKGSAATSAVSLQATYTINFGQTFPFVPKTVIITARSANASGGYFISAITNSTFTVVFNSVPLLGTMSIDYIIVKQ